MKKIFKYFGVILSVALLGSFTACGLLEQEEEMTDVELGIKTFSPQKVVAGMEMTINGARFDQVTEIVFPEEVVVTSFTKVTNEMLRVTVPSGISVEGGKIIVRGEGVQAESKMDLTVGNTSVTGFSKQPGEEITGGDQLTVYGNDLEFINKVELLDSDGNVQYVEDKSFYRKGTNMVVFYIPKKNIYEGSWVGKLHTIDGKVFPLPELAYTPASDGGHWETVKSYIWQNDDPEGHGAVSWNGVYRFALEGTDGNSEAIAEIPTDTWTKMMSEGFYMLAQGSDWVQMRITTGWWSTTWTGEDITTGNERIIDNGDGTYYIYINFEGDPILDVIDVQHLLFTGGGFTPLELYFQEEVWVGADSGPKEVVIWESDGSAGAVSWDGTYRFSNESNKTGEEIYAIPDDVWAKMMSGSFFLKAQGSDWVQMRITTGWWSTTWTGEDITTGNERIIDNEDGTYYIEINFDGDPILDVIDAQHLLFTGGGYTPLKLYFME